MTIDVASCIEKLLYEYDSVIIPELGGIVSKYRSASIDHVQGLLHPPSKSLFFNSHLKINDGLLVAYIEELYRLSDKKAQEAVSQFVDQTVAALEKREIIVFPRVGRLYKDFEGNLQFLQDSTNFNADAYGLPSVQFYPILRLRETASIEAPTPKTSVPNYTPVTETSKLVRTLQSAMPLVAIFALVLLGLRYYSFKNEYTYVEASPQPLPVDQRINKSPTLEEASIISAIDRKRGLANPTAPVKVEESEEEIVADEDGDFVAEINTESVTLGPNEKEGVIIIGTYKKRSSIQQMVDEVYELGYDAYKKKTKRGTRVGVQFIYETEADLDRIHKRVKRKLEKRAWVYKR